MTTENIHTEFHRFLTREDKENLLNQRGIVVWMCGLSGSGKSTIAKAAERVLHQEGHFTTIHDGDNLRSGLNANLGFSNDDRFENIRRFSELAKLFVQQGVITFVSAITPTEELRNLAHDILGDDMFEVYIKASYETCEKRDVKGLYAKAARGEIDDFTGKQSIFMEPSSPDLILDTEVISIKDGTSVLLEAIRQRILP
ncbi:MAG: adenylyl-sulfate kinase [Luteolibacter sp.]